jgi:hypothetical protein
MAARESNGAAGWPTGEIADELDLTGSEPQRAAQAEAGMMHETVITASAEGRIP